MLGRTGSTAALPWRQLAGPFLLLWTAGVYLRLTLMAAPPLATRIADDIGLGQAATGALTTMPLLMLGAAAMAGSLVVALLGARRTIILALLVILAGSAGRGFAHTGFMLLLATAVMGLGIAILQPALPTMVRQWCPGRIALGTAVYMNGMLVGEVLGAGATLPVMLPLAGDQWRLALVLWSLPAGAVALAFLRRGAKDGSASTPDRWMPPWQDPLVWQLGLLLGATAALFFGSNAYMASILGERGEEALLAPGLLLFNSAQVAASLLMLRYGGRWVNRGGPIFWLTAAGAAFLLPFLLLSGWTALWAAFLVSFTSGLLLILLMSLPPLLAPAGGTAALSAGMFTIGYATCFLVPLAGGVLADRLSSPGVALVPVILFSLVMLPVCRLLGRRLRQPR